LSAALSGSRRRSRGELAGYSQKSVSQTVRVCDIANQQLKRFGGKVTDRAREAKLNSSRVGLVVAGDLNMLPPHGQNLPLDSPGRTKVLNSGSMSPLVPPKRPNHKLWNSILAPLTEIEFSEHPHVNISSLSSSGLDRILVAIPPSALLQLNHCSAVIKDPMEYYSLGLSDHSPNYWSCTARKPNTQMPEKARSRWCRRPHFRKVCDSLFALVEGTPSLQESIDICKHDFREAASRTRHFCHQQEPTSRASTLSKLSTISRAVWKGDLRLANRALASSDLAQIHLKSEETVPKLVDPSAFEKDFATAKTVHLAKARERVCSDSEHNASISQRRAQKVKLIDRQAASFRSSSPYIAIGVLIASAAIASVFGLTPGFHSEPEKPTFDLKPIDEEAALRFLKHYCKHNKWLWNLSRPPDIATLRRILRHPRNTAAGFDGICAAAWAFGGDFLEFTLRCLLFSQLNSSFTPENYNQACGFSPQEICPGENRQIQS